MVKNITTSELQDLLGNSDMNLLDVREDFEYEAGHIKEAESKPMSEIQEWVNELDENETYHVICQSGGRSAQVSEFLAIQGFDVVNVVGGMLDWSGDVE